MDRGRYRARGRRLSPLARAGFFVQSPVGLLWPAFAAVGLASITATAVRALDHQDRVTRLLLAMAILWSAALVVLGLTPPITRDELTHHLTLPLWYARAGRVIEIPFAEQAYYPMLLEMLYTPLVAHSWVNAAKYIHGAFGMIACALILPYLLPRSGTRAPQTAGASHITVMRVPTCSPQKRCGRSATQRFSASFLNIRPPHLCVLDWQTTRNSTSVSRSQARGGTRSRR